jgi:hypothetical protein
MCGLASETRPAVRIAEDGFRGRDWVTPTPMFLYRNGKMVTRVFLRAYFFAVLGLRDGV